MIGKSATTRSWGFEDGSWKGPGPPLLVAADFNKDRELLNANIDKLAKNLKSRHAPASAGAGSAKVGIQNYLKTLDSRLRGKDAKGCFKTFYETINIEPYGFSENVRACLKPET